MMLYFLSGSGIMGVLLSERFRLDALVTDVEHDQKIQIQEANYNGHRYIDNFRGWFDPTNPIWGTVTYIYPD